MAVELIGNNRETSLNRLHRFFAISRGFRKFILHVSIKRRINMVSLSWLIVAVQTYLSPVETHCMNINYFIPDEENLTRGFSDDAMTRLRT